MSTIMKNKSLLLLPVGLAIDCGRDPDELNQLAAIGRAQQVRANRCLR